jgi:putative ABC transport system permease protein
VNTPMKFLPLILKNAWRNRRRTILTVISIGISMCLLGMLMAVYHAFYLSDPPPDQALRLVTRHRVSLVFSMPEYYEEKIRHLPGVRAVVLRNWFGGTYKDARDYKNFFARFGTEPDRVFDVFTDIKIAADQKKAFQTERSACIIGREISERLNLHMGDRISLVGDIYPVTLELTVRGIFDSTLGNGILFFNKEYLEQSLPEARRGQIGMLSILCESPDAVPHVAKTVDDMFRNSSAAETKTESEAAFSLSFVNSMGNVKLFLLSICGAVTFTILLVAGNTMAMAVRERVREVGVLKTLGFTPGRVLAILMGESLAIAMAGGTLGYILGSILCAFMRHAPVMFSQIKNLTLGPFVTAVCFGVALTIGLVSSMAPAWKASRTPIVEALRSTD